MKPVHDRNDNHQARIIALLSLALVKKKQTDKDTERQKNKQTDDRSDIQTGRQIDRQTDI